MTSGNLENGLDRVAGFKCRSKDCGHRAVDTVDDCSACPIRGALDVKLGKRLSVNHESKYTSSSEVDRTDIRHQQVPKLYCHEYGVMGAHDGGGLRQSHMRWSGE